MPLTPTRTLLAVYLELGARHKLRDAAVREQLWELANEHGRHIKVLELEAMALLRSLEAQGGAIQQG